MRQIVREIEGISFTRRNTTSIPASGKYLFDTETDFQLRRYAPYDSVTISNYASQSIKAQINQNPEKEKDLAPNNVITFEYPDAIWEVLIINKDTANAINAGLIEIIFAKTGANADKLAKRILRWLPW